MRRLRNTALMSMTILVIGFGAFYLLRAEKARNVLAATTRKLAKHGIHFHHSPVAWEGLFSLRMEEVGLSGPDGLQVRIKGMQAAIRPFRGSGFQAIRALDWDSMSVQAKGLAFDVRGALRPAEWAAMLHIRQLPSNNHALSGLDARLLARGRNSLGIPLAMALEAVRIDHPAFDSLPTTLPSMALQGLLHAEAAHLRIQAPLPARLGHLHANLGLDLDLSEMAIHGKAEIHPQPLENWESAMPGGSAEVQAHFPGASGNLGMHAAIDLPLRHPDGLELRVQLEDSGLHVPCQQLKALSKLPGWVHPNALPPAILEAIVLSEDAGFRQHKGFDLEIMKAALLENIRNGRFVRGGGTISMQLVRNQFLHQGKQLRRKASEVLLTALLERGGGISKDEILGIYLNTIEWGPGIHGIREAAQFYFRTTPQRLSLDQGLFLAAIIPNPRQYRHLLQPDGSLGEFGSAYFETMRWMLYEAGHIPEAELDAALPIFRIPAIARRGA